MSVEELIKQDIHNIINNNTNKLQILYIYLFNAKCKRDIASINNQINYIRNNEEVFDLICKTKDVDNIHEYKMLTDLDYKYKHMKINNNICSNCQSNNIVSDDEIACIDCGSVLGYQFVTGYNQKQNYNKYVNNKYKRKTYVRVQVENKLHDLTNVIKERIIKEAEFILYFKLYKIKINYRYLFRYILNKLQLYEYVDRFPQHKTKSVAKRNNELYKFN